MSKLIFYIIIIFSNFIVCNLTYNALISIFGTQYKVEIGELLTAFGLVSTIVMWLLTSIIIYLNLIYEKEK